MPQLLPVIALPKRDRSRFCSFFDKFVHGRRFDFPVKPVRAKPLISCHSADVRFLRTLCETLKSTIAKRQNLRHAKSPTNQLCPSLPYANPFE